MRARGLCRSAERAILRVGGMWSRIGDMTSAGIVRRAERFQGALKGVFESPWGAQTAWAIGMAVLESTLVCWWKRRATT